MRVEEQASTDQVRQGRERYVPRGVATTDLVVSRAWGARIWDAEGREYIDFAGGIACQNLGHGNAAVVRAVHEQVDRFLHQCFMVGAYEPYVAVAEKLDELWPGNAATKTLLLNSGAEAIENAVKISRAATGRAGVVVFDRAFHGRTNLTMAMTSKLVYKQGFGPLATDVHRAPAPYPYRGVSTEDALARPRASVQAGCRPHRGCVHRARARSRRRRIHPDAARVHPRTAETVRRVRDRLRGRRGAIRLRSHRNDLGNRALRRRARPARVGQDARRRSPARGCDRSRRVDGRPASRRARRHVRRQPGRMRCGARRPRRAVGAGIPRARRADREASPHAARRDGCEAIRSSGRSAVWARCSRSS